MSGNDESILSKIGGAIGTGAKDLLGSIWNAKASGTPDTPPPAPAAQNPGGTPDLAGALRTAMGGSAGTNPAPQGGSGWGTGLGAVVTPLLLNWLTWGMDMGPIGRGLLTAVAAPLGMWLGNMISDALSGWFGGSFRQAAAPPAPNAPSVGVRLQNGDPRGSVPQVALAAGPAGMD